MPLLKGSSKKVVSQNISEFRTGPSYAHTLRKFGSKKAKAQSIAVALSTARKYARKAEGGGRLETTGLMQEVDGPEQPQDPRMKAISIRPVEGTPNAPEQPVKAPPEQGSWGPPTAVPASQPAMSEDDLTKAYLKNLTGAQTGEAATPFKKVISGLPQGMVDWVKSPGEMMKGPEQVQHATPGMETEEEAFLQNLNNQNYDRQMTDFGAGTAVGMVGGSKFFGTPENAVGIGGGKLNQPTFTHLKTDSHGQPVAIDKPTWPSSADTWTDPSKTATFSFSQTMPEKLNGIPLQSWKPPHDWVEHFDQNPVHVEEPVFQPDKYKKPASGVVILEPDGRVWLTAPTNQFGGYNASFPKGKMEGGLSMAENAVKEAYEETGLKVKIQGFLTDVDKDTSRTRYYIATRESGTPTDMGWESQGVHVANIHDVGKYLNKPADMQVIEALKNWAKEKAPQKSSEPQPSATKNVPDANGKYFGKYFHPYDLNPEDVKKFTFQKSNHETGGSNPGGIYHAPDGTPIYIKQFEGDHAIERTYNEKLANELLKLAGVPVANVRMTQLKGHPAIASDMVPGKELNTVSPTKYANLEGLRSHYPAHLWTGNYDFVGTGKNNIMVMPNGQTIHIDPGGALRYRAQGKLKGPDMWGPNVEHFKMTPGKDLTDVMGEHYNNKQMMAQSAQRVANITDQQIHDLVQQYGPLQKGEKAKLEETLKARRDGVAKLYGVDKGGTSAPPASGGPAPTPSTYGQIVAKAMDYIKNGTPTKKPPTGPTGDKFLDILMNGLSKSGHKVQTWHNGQTTIIQNGKTTTTPAKPSNLTPPSAKAAPIPKNFDPKAKATELYEGYRGNVDEIAEHIFEYQKDYGKKVADQIGEKLPMSVRMEVGDAVSELESEREQLKDHPKAPAQATPTATGPGAPKTPAEVAQLASDKASAKFLLKSHGDDVGGIAKEVWDLANAIGPKSADNIIKHLPTEMYPELGDHLEAISSQHGVDPWKPQHEPPEYAAWGDNPDHPAGEPPIMDEGYKSSLGGDYDLKHHRKEWFHDLTNVPHSGLVPHGYTGIEFQTPGQLAQLLHNFDKFHKLGIVRDIDLQKYKPPTISDKDLKRIQPTKASFEHAIANGFAEWLTLFRGSKNIPSGQYPPFFRDPFQKKGSYKNERSIDLADQYNVANSYGGMYPSGPVMARSSKTLEFYYPNLIGKLYDKKNPGSSYNGTLKEAIIEAAHHNGYDLVIAHGMDDLGGSNQTQYMFLNTVGTLRAFSAKLDPKHLRPALSEADFQMARNPLLGLAGGTAFVYGALKGKGDDEKMARGGKVKEQEPQDHEFINFAKGGMINSDIPGRTDKIPMKVATGAYVLPADIPSALGQGNTIAGKSILDKMFNSGPYGLPLAKGKSQKFQMPRLQHLKGYSQFAQGGRAAAEKALPANHQLGMKVPKGGSMCASCSFYKGNGICGNKGFAQWHGSGKLPQPADEYCCDLYAHTKKMADGGPVDSIHTISRGPEYDKWDEAVGQYGRIRIPKELDEPQQWLNNLPGINSNFDRQDQPDGSVILSRKVPPNVPTSARGGGTDHTPIIAAGGEYIIHPDEVMRQGAGSMTAGHKVLDKFVLHTRKKHIRTLKSLKPPK